MKIILCDDNPEDLCKVEQLIQKYNCTCLHNCLTIEKYSDPAELFDQIASYAPEDIFILDMIMSEKSGIDIGRQIRQNNCQNVIIYITASDDFALDAYNVHAARYLLKPFTEAELFEALNYALSVTEIKKDPLYVIKTRGGLVSVPYSQIEYIENTSRMLDVHLTDGKSIKSIFIRKSFDEEIRELLGDNCFIHVHKSYVMNMNYIKQLMPNSILTESGETIPISKTRAAGVKKEYLTFISEQYR